MRLFDPAPFDAVEVSPSSEWCQRWTAGQPRWARPGGVIDPARYHVEAIDEGRARGFVVAHHYSASYPAARLRYGLFEDARTLVGVAVLSVPTQAKVLTNVFPDLDPYVESLELGRFVLADRVPANGESWFLGRIFREAAAVGVRGLVAFSDPVARRTADGDLLFPGHVGTIYAATNARYCGRSTPSTLVLLPDGTTLHARAMSKVRAQERGHEYVEDLLVRHGARRRRTGTTPAQWLTEALGDAGCTRLRHHGNHRFAFALGDRTARRQLRITPMAEPYPKETDDGPAAP